MGVIIRGIFLPLTNRLQRQTSYQFTVNLAGLSDDVLSNYLLLAVEFDDNGEEKSLSEIVIQPKIQREPKTKTEKLLPALTLEFIPPHFRGDKDFEGNGPWIKVSAFIFYRPKYVFIDIWMEAWEVGGGKSGTAAVGNSWADRKQFRIYDAEPGWHIKRVDGKKVWHPLVEFTDTNHADYVENTDFGVVTVIGDTDGNESGTKTRVKIRPSYRIPILLEEDIPGLRTFAPAKNIQMMNALSQPQGKSGSK